MASSVALLVVLTAAAASELHVERETAEGRVRGTVLHVVGRRVEQYRGIPFAEPPLGELRFLPPRPKEPWNGTLDATASTAATGCPQVESAVLGMHGVTYAEDCLRLNVWVPDRVVHLDTGRPVLVWIHGGGFNFGSATQANYSGATISAMADLLVVSMNYRLGILGFMSADSPEAPGNVGLLDQLMALQWVQRNIAFFGGDPQRVTLFGESAGAASAHAHVLSPMSEGLFRRAVLMSGSMSSIDIWDMVHESMAKGSKVADIVGCSKGGSIDLSSNPDEIVDCFRGKSADELVRAAAESVAPRLLAFLPTYHDSFLPKMPLAALKRGFFGSVDIIAGVTLDEAAFPFLASAKPELLAEDLEVSESLIDTLNAILSAWQKVDTPHILDNYTADVSKDDGNALRRLYLDYLSDWMFNCPLRLLAEKHSDRGSNVFAYVFGHKLPTAPFPSWTGAPHISDLAFAFGHLYAQQPDTPDGSMSEAFVRILATFAESGVPELPSGQKWPKYTRSSPVVITMGHGQFNETRGFRESECERWKSVF
ncbi:acetylcholinesterase-like [Amblyomma americanum]|uniref:Carboxylic ester hydrolase n=1 Tax=Amblyomma americanum TaxID=6943 RepID=A0AAQ4D386_AMBAM